MCSEKIFELYEMILLVLPCDIEEDWMMESLTLGDEYDFPRDDGVEIIIPF